MRPPSPPDFRALGAILAGGASRRYGAPKAAATVGGVPLLERVRAALLDAGLDPVLVGSHAERAATGLPRIADVVRGAGPIGGVVAALRLAAERGQQGALCVACDMPFLAPALLRAVVERGLRSPAAAVVPGWGEERREPLCAWYSLHAGAALEARLAGPDRSLRSALVALDAEVLPLAAVCPHEDPERIFLNVNTRADRERAERLARARPEVPNA